MDDLPNECVYVCVCTGVCVCELCVCVCVCVCAWVCARMMMCKDWYVCVGARVQVYNDPLLH